MVTAPNGDIFVSDGHSQKGNNRIVKFSNDGTFIKAFGGTGHGPGQLYGPRIRQVEFSAKKIIRFGSQRLTVGADFYNLANNNVTLLFNGTFVPGVPGWNAPTSYMNPRVIRLNAEYAF